MRGHVDYQFFPNEHETLIAHVLLDYEIYEDGKPDPRTVKILSIPEVSLYKQTPSGLVGETTLSRSQYRWACDLIFLFLTSTYHDDNIRSQFLASMEK